MKWNIDVPHCLSADRLDIGMRTPWGNIEEMPDRRLPPGPATAPEEAARNQRERLFAAMIAACEEGGYDAATVADLVRLSGVSRRSFYSHFADKASCFEATIEAVLRLAVEPIASRLNGTGQAEARARGALELFLNLAAAQPAAARLCLVDALAAGEPGLRPLQTAIDELSQSACSTFDQIPGHKGRPAQLSRAIGGGVHRVVRERLLSKRGDELPNLAGPLFEWATAYPTPPAPLVPRRRRRRVEIEPVSAFAGDPDEAVIRAFAEVAAARGYAAATMAEIAAAASISQGTLYGRFESKEALMRATLESSGAHLEAALLPPLRRSKDWAGAVPVTFEALCRFLAAEPAIARLRAIEVYAAGPWAVEQRDATGAQVVTVLTARLDPNAPIDPLVAEATQGALYSAIEEQVRGAGPEALPEIAPLLTYITLTPLLGAELACEAANGDGRRKRPSPG